MPETTFNGDEVRVIDDAGRDVAGVVSVDTELELLWVRSAAPPLAGAPNTSSTETSGTTRPRYRVQLRASGAVVYEGPLDFCCA